MRPNNESRRPFHHPEIYLIQILVVVFIEVLHKHSSLFVVFNLDGGASLAYVFGTGIASLAQVFLELLPNSREGFSETGGRAIETGRP